MAPQLIYWVLWILATAGKPMVRTDFSPYDGPLAERLITAPVPEYSANFSIDVVSPALEGFEYWLRRNPIHVRVPGHRYQGWGIRTYPERRGSIYVVRFNDLLTPTEQPYGAFHSDPCEMLRWAFSVLDHYQLPYDPMEQHWQLPREEIIERYRANAEPIDWQGVAELLRANGRAVPDDLFEQPTR
jgi:hypothetical protein